MCGILTLSLVLDIVATRLPPPPTNFRKVEKKILDQLFSPTVYDSAIRPKGFSVNTTDGDGPTKVLVNVFVRSFEKIDDVKMEFSIQITFRQQWNDNRLAFSDMGGKIRYLTMTERSKVWMPDQGGIKCLSSCQPNFKTIISPETAERAKQMNKQ